MKILSEEIELIPETVELSRQEVLLILPENIRKYVQELDENDFVPNMLKDDACQLCAFNHVKLDEAKVNYLKRTMCNSCDAKIPYIHVRTTGVVQFNKCPSNWFQTHVKHVKFPVTKASLYGIVHHMSEEFIIRFLSEKTNVQMLRDIKGSILTVATAIKNLVNKHLESEKSFDKKEDYNEYQKLKNEFIDYIDLMSFIYAMRIVSDVNSDGDYIDMMVSIYEQRLATPLELNGVKFLVTGKPDKIYELGDKGSYFIRDDKTKAKLSNNPNTEDWEIQIGGYKFLCDSLFGHRAEGYGIIWYPRYFDFVPVKANVPLFLSIVTKMAKSINKNEELKGCKSKFCSTCSSEAS